MYHTAGIINHIVYSCWRFALKVETNQVESRRVELSRVESGRLDKSRELRDVYWS